MAGPNPVRRAPLRVAFDLVWAAVRLAVSFVPVLLYPSWLTWVVTVLLVLGVLALVVAAFTYSRVATCPGCGKLLGGLSARLDCVGHQCEHCRQFVEVKDGELVSTPEDRVDDVPSFGVLLRGVPAELPELCCACGAPSTRKLAVTGAQPALDMPHCDAHDNGARVRKSGASTLLRVGSLRFARVLAERNGLEVVGTNPRPDRPEKFPWGYGIAGLALVGFGVGVFELIGAAERSGVSIGGNALMVLIYAILGKQVLAGIFVVIGTMFLMNFVVNAGALLRLRLWPY
jgi:hypothetical protein